jgi:hypothetical protein
MASLTKTAIHIIKQKLGTTNWSTRISLPAVATAGSEIHVDQLVVPYQQLQL